MSSADAPLPPRNRFPRGQGDRLKAEILAAAEAMLLAGADEQALSIRAVSAAVGVTPPAIYRHFSDKDELLLAVCEKAFADFDQRVQSAAADEPDPLRALRRLGRAYVEFGRSHPEQYRILFLKRSDEVSRRAAERGGAGFVAFGHLVEAVARCIDAGELADQDATRAAVCLWAALHGVTALLLSMPHFPWPPVPELVEAVLDIQLAGLAAPHPTSV